MDAIEEFFKKSNDFEQTLANKLAADLDIIRNAMQEVVVKILEKPPGSELEKFKTVADVKAYFYNAIKNEMKDENLSKIRHKTDCFSDLEDNGAFSTEDFPDIDETARERVLQNFWRIVEKIAEKELDSEILRLRDQLGLKWNEIAERLESSANALEIRHRKIIKKIKQKLSELNIKNETDLDF